MYRDISATVASAVRETIPFLVITVLWIAIMLCVYGLFLVAIPQGAEYGPAVHASVFVPPLIGFLGHTLRVALRAP